MPAPPMVNGSTVSTPVARLPPARVTLKRMTPPFSLTAPPPAARAMVTVTGSSSAMVTTRSAGKLTPPLASAAAWLAAEMLKESVKVSPGSFRSSPAMSTVKVNSASAAVKVRKPPPVTGAKSAAVAVTRVSVQSTTMSWPLWMAGPVRTRV